MQQAIPVVKDTYVRWQQLPKQIGSTEVVEMCLYLVGIAAISAHTQCVFYQYCYQEIIKF
jgi:hypothetical protein